MRRIGPYELEYRLGSGGMAEVWKGLRTGMGGASKAVALKILAGHLSNKPTYRAMFIEEAKLSMLLSHSNIVQVFDVSEDQGRTYMAMEYVEGVNLSELCAMLWARNESLPMVAVAYIVGEVLQGLGYAHQLKHEGDVETVVHRDISPQNVMISTSGAVKIMDFGIARFASKETSGVHIKGKLRYMPPEQLRGESRRGTIDLFAVGAILHELINGRTFRDDIFDESRLYGMILEGEYPSLVIDEAEIPAEINELRLGLLEAQESERLASAHDGLEILHRWAGYRNASVALGRLVESVIEQQREHAEVVTERERKDASTVQAWAEAEAGGTLVDPRDPGPGAQAGAAVSDKAAADARGGMAWLPILLIVFGLFVGLGSVAFGLGWFQDPAGAQGPAQPELAAPTQPVLVAPEDAEAGTETGTETGDAETETETETGDAETETETGETETGESDPAVAEPAVRDDNPAQRKPVKVEFVANDFFYVEIKIANYVLALEPVKTIELKPGSYPLRLRKKASEPWTRAGRIKIEPGKAHRVEMIQPAGAKVTTR